MALVAFPSVAKTLRLGQQLHQPQALLINEYSGQRHTMRLGDGRWAGTARITVDVLTDEAIQEVLEWIGRLADGANWTPLPLGVTGFVHDGTRLRLQRSMVYTPAVPALTGDETLTAATSVNAFWRGGREGFGPLLDRSPDWIEDFEFPWIERLGA